VTVAEKGATFRFYEELNDFLPPRRRKVDIRYAFRGRPAVKDSIEALGVPHTEVDLILANGRSVGFDYHLDDGDRIAVYPVFESLDITPLVRLRPRPLRRMRFVLDGHLGKLARLLRLLGFDALHRQDHRAADLIAAEREGRIILTRNRGLLKTGCISRGYWIRATEPGDQVRELLRRFDLRREIKPFQRCLACNGVITPVAKEEIQDRLAAKTRAYYDEFRICGSCRRIYWKGTHYAQLKARVQSLNTRCDRQGATG
jgi:uncharacterized protein with PIN domain